MTPFRPLRTFALMVCTVALPAAAQSADPLWSVTGYLQQSWPKQTETNRQIKQEINAGLGTHFKTWDDTTNANVGLLVLRTVAPCWKVGVQVDYSQGKIQGKQDVMDPILGPGTVSFEQKYTAYADLLAIVQYRPFGERGRLVPFLLGGLGFAYEKDTTRLGFASSAGAGVFELLKVDNSGWFPSFTTGFGVDVSFSERRDWYAQLGVSYSWARLKRNAPATGLLAPGPTVKADTDSTGPNAWIGLGRRF